METQQDTSPLIKEVLLDASPERVWQALTDTEQMKQWYFNVSGFKPEVGNVFTFEGGDDCVTYKHICEITELVPNIKMRHSWSYEGYPGKSFVTWDIIPEGDKTKLRLTHEGLHTFPSAENKSFARESFQGGWNEIVGKLLPEYLQKNP